MRHFILKTVCLFFLVLGAGKAYSQVDFKADVTSGCFPLTVHFTDLTAGSSDWEWDFGNNNRSELQHPSAVFTAPGTYSITLKARVDGAPVTRIKANFIVVHGFPEVDFTFDKLTGCSPLTVKFSDKTSTASGSITGWFWAFGDGASALTANPTHVFEQSGEYTITLKARNEHGCEKSKTIESGIKVNGPKTKYSPDKTAVCSLPATFKLTNETTGNQPITYTWNFGDGTTSTEASPEHTYNTAGVFTPILKAKDASGCESTFQTTLNAGSEGGIDFNASSLKVCLNQEIEFTAISAEPIVSSLWTFSDGSTAAVNDPKHSYSDAGNYNVTLTAQLLGHTCASVITKKVEVAIPVVPSFTKTVDCDYNLTLTSTSQHAKRYEWYVDDVLISTASSFVSPVKSAGEQTVRLVAFDAADCSYAIEEVVDVPMNPVVSFLPNVQQACSGITLSGCAPFNVAFNGSITFSDTNNFQWNFGDGTTSTDLKPEHTFNNPGLYQVSLSATNSKNCKTTSTAFVVVSNTTPVANFTIDKTVACAGEDVKFTSTSANADFWCWDYGDGNTGNGKTVVHKYLKPGTYTVKLTAKNAGCSSEKIVANAVTIKDPYVNFTSEKACNDPFNVKLTNVSENYDVIEWDFGDGERSSVANVGNHRYASPGTYVTTLTGTNHSTGCTTIASNTFIIQEVKALFDLDNDKPCKGAPMTFTDKSVGAYSLLWTVGPNLSSKTTFTTSIKAPGDYVAKLEATDQDGCKSTATKNIKVIDMEAAFSFTASSNCDEFRVDFEEASKGTPEPTTWDWSFGDGETGTGRKPSHSYEEPGKYSVTLRVSNGLTTCEFVGAGAVNFTIPEPDFAIAKANFCIGEQVIVANTTKNAVFYEWDYGNGQHSDFFAPVITYDQTGRYDLTLFAQDVYGCQRKITKEDLINVVKPTANFKVDNTTGACPPFTAHFEDISVSDITKWEWNFGDGKTSVLQDPANIYLKPGDFNVTLKVTDKNGCTDTKTAGQFVKVGGPYGSFTTQGANSCTNQTVVYNATTTNAAVLRWDFGDGVVIDSRNSKEDHAYTQTGSFTPSLLLIDANGCQNLADGPSMMIIKDTTAVSFTIAPTCIRPGEDVKLVGKHETKDVINWSWLVDGTYVGSATQFNATIDEPGLHVITGLAANQFNCISHVYDTVRIQGPIEVIPNVVTPNGDGYNDVFKMIGLENSVWDIDIVNRWGNLVFREKAYKGDWDGDEQPAGVYYFVLRNALCDERPYRGYISVHR